MFATTCPYTLASLPSWKAIAARLADASRVRVYGLSVDSLDVARAYAVEHGLGFPIVTFTEPKTRALYHLLTVPQVLILDDEGRVLFTRRGVIESDAAVDSIVAAARSALCP